MCNPRELLASRAHAWNLRLISPRPWSLQTQIIVGVVNVVAAVVGFVAIAGLIFIAARPDRDREREDEARAYYDRHGSWPDDS